MKDSTPIPGYKVSTTPIRSRALSFALLAKLPPSMTYSVRDTEKYTGIPIEVLSNEIRAGRLKSCVKAGNVRGLRIDVREMDRWMNEHAA